MAEVPSYVIKKSDFLNPAGDQGKAYQAGLKEMLGKTTGAPPQLTSSPTYSGANIGPTALSGGAQLGQTAIYGGAQLGAGQYNQTFGQEQALANQLALQAQGLGPSVAQVTAQQQAQQNIANQMAMLGSQRGSANPALAQYQAAQAAAQAQQAAAQQAVLGRTQEALAAQGQQGQLLGAMNQQAQGFAGTQAQLQQQAALQSMGAINAQNLAQAQMGQQNQQFNVGNMNAQQLAQAQLMQQAGLSNQQIQQQTAIANLQAALQQGQINAQQYDQWMNQLAQMNLAQYQGNISKEQLAVQQQLGLGNIAIGQAAQSAATTGSVMQGVGTGLSLAAMAFSDINVKKNIKSGKKELEYFLNSINIPKAMKLII